MPAWARGAGLLLGAGALALATLITPVAGAALTLHRAQDEVTVTSSAGVTWKVVFAVARVASHRRPGGVIARTLYIPADSAQSIANAEPSKFSALGLANLEWRYIDGGGIRSDIGRYATLSAFEIKEQTREKIVLRTEGRWPKVSNFKQTITIDPDGFETDLELTWAGPTGFKSMWWLLSHLRADRIDGDKVTIEDRDTKPVPLPIKRGNIFSLPSGIDFPYTVTFPFRAGEADSMQLKVVRFDDKNKLGKRYEFWPILKGHYYFLPRWVGKFEKRTYRFTWRWQLNVLSDKRKNSPAGRRLALAKQRWKAGEWGKAERLLQEAAAEKGFFRREAQEILGALRKKLRGELAAAQKRTGLDAVQALRRFARTYEGTTLAREATGLAETIRNDPKPVAIVLRKKTAEAQEAFDRATAKERSGALLAARRAYLRLAARYAETHVAGKARDAAARLASDPRVTAARNEAQARKQYQFARNMLLNGMRDEARDRLRRIAEQFPDCEYGRKAREAAAALQ